MESRIERLCVERGLKMTGQRRVIARVLSEASDHPDVEELYRRAAALDSRISVATVYRTVRLLEEKGILERRDFGGGRARYEATEHGHHYHLIDVDTGRVIEFENTEHEKIIRAIAQGLGFDLVSHRLELFGRRRVETELREPEAAPPGADECRCRRHRRRHRRTTIRRHRGKPGCDPPYSRDGQAGAMTAEQAIRGLPRDERGFGEIRAGNLGVRLAVSAAEIDAVQALRFSDLEKALLQQVNWLFQVLAEPRVADREHGIAHQRDCVHAAHALALIADFHIDGIPYRFDAMNNDGHLERNVRIGVQEVLQSGG